jgi:uncharacterized MAPEG superfamily protein
MSIEILMLVATISLLLLLMLIQGIRNFLLLGLGVVTVSQRYITPCESWHDRLHGAIGDLIEATAIFAPLVTIMNLLSVNSEQTEFGAQLFFASCVGHAVFSIVGLPIARAGAWFTGVMSILLIAAVFFH